MQNSYNKKTNEFNNQLNMLKKEIASLEGKILGF